MNPSLPETAPRLEPPGDGMFRLPRKGRRVAAAARLRSPNNDAREG
jgi:hypothetical protein